MFNYIHICSHSNASNTFYKQFWAIKVKQRYFFVIFKGVQDLVASRGLIAIPHITLTNFLNSIKSLNFFLACESSDISFI